MSHMLFDLAAWVVILLVAWAVGRGVLALLRVNDLRPGDAFVIAAWVGLVVLTFALLATSIATPLTPMVTAIVGVGLAALGTALSARLAESSGIDRASVTRAVVPYVAGGVGVLAVGAAALASDAVTLYDSLVYHIGIMRWLREHGTVPGMALVHNRLGHVSPWFTLAAPFDYGFATNRTANIPLGVALVLVGLQTAIAAGRAVARRAWVADWFFIVLAGALVLAVNTKGAATPSPDVAANVLIVVAAWSILVVSQADASRDAQSGMRRAMIPLLLALGAAGMKLFAVPVALVAAGYLVVSNRRGEAAQSLMRPTLIAAAATVVAIGPFIAANIAASGCPLYPSPIGCTQLPWSVGAHQAADYAEYIRDVARWDRRGNIPPNDPTGWILPWIGAHPVIALLAALSPVIALVLLRHARRDVGRQAAHPRLAAPRALVVLALVGIAFAAWQAPAPRFLYAIVLLIPGLAAAYWLHAAAPRATGLAFSERHFAIGFASAASALGLAYGVASQKLNVRSALVRGSPLVHVRARDLVLPAPPQAQSRLFRWRVNDVDVLTPVPRPIADTLGYHSVIAHNADFEKCSTAPLPCTPYLPGRDIRLRRASAGLAAGFVRVSEPDLAGRVATCIGELSTVAARPTGSGDAAEGQDGSGCRPNESREAR